MIADPIDGTTLNAKDAKSANLVDLLGRYGQVKIEFTNLTCQLFLGVARDTTVLDAILLLDTPPRGILKGVVLVAFTSIFCDYIYEIIDFMYKGKDRISGVLEKDGKEFVLKIKLNEVKQIKLELVS